MATGNITQTVVVTTVLTTFGIVGLLIYKKWKLVKIPTEWEKVGNVKKIHLYPLKSGHRVELQKAEVTPVGLQLTKEQESAFQLKDRALVVYGAKDNEFRTGRTYPKMVLIDVSVHDEEHLAIDAPTMRTLYVKIPKRAENAIVRVKCWNEERIEAIDCGDEAASWLSRYIIERDQGLRLGYNDASKRRDIRKTHHILLDFYKHLGNQSTGLFSDLSSVTIINQRSVNDLNAKLGGADVAVENFRQNIVIDGPKLKPFEEDDWEWIKIGDGVIFRNVKACTRCIFTTINPEDGVRDRKREPLKTLESYRMGPGPEKSPRMGLNVEVTKTGLINLEDDVYIGKKS